MLTLVKNYEGTNIKAHESFAQGFIFSANGLKFFTTGDNEDTILQFSLAQTI